MENQNLNENMFHNTTQETELDLSTERLSAIRNDIDEARTKDDVPEFINVANDQTYQIIKKVEKN